MNHKLTTDILIKALSTDCTKAFVKRLSASVIEQCFDLNEIIDLTFHPDAQIGFRAAWLLDTTMLAFPELYIDNLEYFTNRMGDVTNASCKRHYARIMMHLTSPKAPDAIKAKLALTDLYVVVEKCFDWIIDPKVKVAVKVFAADTLYHLSSRYDWIEDELASQIEFLMRDGGAAIQSRGKKLLALIKKQKVKI
jgi:hypothetical protein